MKTHGWGRIVNISSIHGRVASPFKSAYITAKHGLIGFTRTAALEGGEHGITVNAICPAYVRTPLVESQIADQARTRGISIEDVVEQVMLEPAAVKRLITPEEVAALVVYLCSDIAGRHHRGRLGDRPRLDCEIGEVQMQADLLIHDGTVIDGTSSPTSPRRCSDQRWQNP